MLAIMSPAGFSYLWRREMPIVSVFILTPKHQKNSTSAFFSHLNVFSFYSTPLLYLCHRTRILSACLSCLCEKCRQAAAKVRMCGGVPPPLCSQFKDNWIRNEITSIYMSESCDLIFRFLFFFFPFLRHFSFKSNVMATLYIDIYI